MFSNCKTVTFEGIRCREIEVQVCISNGIPSFNILGLPTRIISESKDRIKSALENNNIPLPQKKIVVNLSPVELVKDGNHYDLPITVAILVAMKKINIQVDNYLFMGELSLQGNILKVRGGIPSSVYASKHNNIFVISSQNYEDVVITKNKKAILAFTLKELIFTLNSHLNQVENDKNRDDRIIFSDYSTNIQNHGVIQEIKSEDYINLSDIKHQSIAKRALIIAASGGHNIIMKGVPGTGKSMLSKAIKYILPELTLDEKIEVASIRSISTCIGIEGLQNDIPFRAPHSSCSMAALIGGGKLSQPGEISLASNGILFLDELPEFSKQVLEALRQPLEDKKILISRANQKIEYPAKFLLVAAMNPCKCGYATKENAKKCKIFPRCEQEYQSRISAPIMDRIDICITIPEINIFNEEQECSFMSTEQAKAIVSESRIIQEKRFYNKPYKLNSYMDAQAIEEYVYICPKTKEILQNLFKKNMISMRGYFKILKLMRTIADINQEDVTNHMHLKEALNYYNLRNT